MNNLQFLQRKVFPQLSYKNIIKSHYDISTNTILILNSQSELSFLKYNAKTLTIQQTISHKIPDIENQQPIYLGYLVENSTALIFTEQGSILTVNETDGDIQIQAQNQDGISGGTVSPAQDYIYVVTKNNTIVMLDSQFQLIKQIMLDQSVQEGNAEKCDAYNPRFTWKQDGTYLAINIQTDKGRKCHTRDNMLGLFRSPAKSDIQADGLVQSVSERSWPNMGSCCAWQPSGGLIAGNDFIDKNGKKINRVIFWQKNSLRHLQFELPDRITDIVELTWSPDSQILCVQAMNILSQRLLLLYHRSNYHWYLKYSYKIPQNSHYFLQKHSPSSSHINQLILLHCSPYPKIQILTYKLDSPKSAFVSYQLEQKINSCSLFYNVDYNKIMITNFGRNLVPPPMSECQYQLEEGWILGVRIQGERMLVVGNQCVIAYQYTDKSVKKYKYLNQQDVPIPVINLQLLSLSPLKFISENYVYKANQQQQIYRQILQDYKQKPIQYTHTNTLTNIHITVSPTLTDNSSLLLHANQLTKLSENCTSYLIYHQFLVFTCSSNSMYDKLFVFDMELDKWLFGQTGDDSCGDQSTIVHRLEEIQQKKELNYRAIERGARILTATKNKLIFQLPRGNLQGIYPKIFMIKWVKKCIQQKKFKQAFETIRTHKLDLNLLYDLNPTSFTENAKQILSNIKKSDYINLFVSQLKNQISSELQYCLTPGEIDDVESYVEVKLENNKIKEVCKIVSESLREVDKDRFILSIFTAEIKMGLLEQVLFEIKDMKKGDVQTIIPPHILNQQQKSQKKGPKKLSSQEILQYVCWLVDANVIYEASLLTYDMQLASIAARCTQMDPKQYIPYLEELKQIKSEIEFKKKICLDLKKYEKAVEVMAVSHQQLYMKQAIQLIKKHKLFKTGLRVFKKCNDHSPQLLALHQQYLIKVKMIMVEELKNSGENNQAYNVLMTCKKYEEALNIAMGLGDGNKIKYAIDGISWSIEQKREKIKNIIQQSAENFKNKSQLAELYLYIDDIQNATLCYLKASNYIQAYKYLPKLPQEFIETNFITNMQLIYSLLKNQLLKDKSILIQKTNRLHKVHKLKKIQGITFTNKNQLQDDMYSQISVSSRAGSSSAYTISTTTGMKKKKDKKRSILTRNVKEGSLLQEEYLIAYINDIKSRAESNIKQSKQLIQHLIYINLIEQAQNLRDIAREYGKTMNTKPPKYYIQLKFEQQHPEAAFLYSPETQEKDGKDKQKNKFSIDSFNYLF